MFSGKRSGATLSGNTTKSSKTSNGQAASKETTPNQTGSAIANGGNRNSGNAAPESVVWNYLEEKWPDHEDRPSILRDREIVKTLTFREVHYLMKNEKLAEKKSSTMERATKDVKPKNISFKEGDDNRNDVIHAASLLRSPISNPENYWQLMPKKRKAIFKAMPLKFLGGNSCIADKTIIAAHDRTTPQLLKHYLTENCSVANRPKREFKTVNDGVSCSITDDWWDTPASLKSVQEAYNNHDLLMWLLWPQDPTPHIMARLMLRYKWLASSTNDMAKRIEVLTHFFNAALEDNASRAVNEETIMSYLELETLLKSVMARNGLRPELPITEKRATDEPVARAVSLQQKTKPTTRQRTNYNELKTQAGLVICTHFNRGVCRNSPFTFPQTGEKGCKDQGNSYVHACNVYMKAKNGLCEGRTHGRAQHR